VSKQWTEKRSEFWWKVVWLLFAVSGVLLLLSGVLTVAAVAS
jgi:hypothetical protein